MQYKVFYTTDNGKKFFGRVDASSEKEAIKKMKERYHDIVMIDKVSQD